MLAFISQILMMLSLAALLYLIAKTLPRIDENPPKTLSLKEHWVTRRIEDIDQKIKITLEKLLRRIEVVLLKWENKVSKKVHKLKEESAKTASDILKVEKPACAGRSEEKEGPLSKSKTIEENSPKR
ncbi:MAG: hypothetical protein Q8P01_02590 [bacterium]|nr:hypothetical protein [bacterium]